MNSISTPKSLNLLESLLSPKNLITADNFLGLRSWGLILYGILPSNLALLGALKIDVRSFNEFSAFTIILVSILPIIFLTMLIQDQNKRWYLTTDHLYSRSLTITFLILLLSTSIIGLSGIITHKYEFGVPQNFSESTAIIECFLSTISSLVISSSFFILALTRETDLPGLPSISFVKLIEKLDFKMRDLVKIKDWKQYTDYDTHYIILIDEIENIINEINNLKGNNLAKKSIIEIKKDVENLKEGLNKIGSGTSNGKKTAWEIYFDDSYELSPEQLEIRKSNDIFCSIQRIKKLKIGA